MTEQEFRAEARAEYPHYRIEDDAEVSLEEKGAWVQAWSGPQTWTRVYLPSAQHSTNS
jgi:hypothetical protein